MQAKRIVFVGVGGQGNLLITRLLGEAALAKGIPALVSEIHGMAQRGGVVHSFVLIGGFKSPKITEGEADVLLGFEPLETVRALDFVQPGGTIISSLSPVLPLSVCMGRDSYPDIEQIREKCRLCAKDSYFIPCSDLARETGVMQTANMVLMGALFSSGLLLLGLESLRQGVKKHLKAKIVDVNLQAIELGAEYSS